MSWRIGVDIGGTFTDVALVSEESGEIGIAKVPTTPRDLAAGVVTALESAIAQHGVAPGEVSFLSHATTVVTNALLEQKGARAALITTRGFRDVLELRRSARADLYDMFQDPPSVLVPRHLRLEVTERLDAQGDVVTPLAEDEIDGLIDFLRAHEVEAIAVCFLYSFLNDAHESLVGARLRDALPDIPIFLSSEVLPEIREFERTSTTAICAYVGPILASYLERLDAAVTGMGLPSLHVMASSGGVLEVGEVLTMPAMAVESGPAAGVIAATHIGRDLDMPNMISFDMGGTTAKASLIEDGKVETTSEYEVGGSGNVSRWLHGTGHPIRVPVIDLAEVSAGGGSIAWIDPGGALRVGPRSAGAEPGPVCYGQGGTEPTVTDADLVLGYLDPEQLLGGDLPVEIAHAEQAIRDKIATPLGLDVINAALGIVSVVNNSMAEALRIVSVERGHDAREFSLVAFGGAGPVHAVALAEELEIPRVVIPPIPGGFSALGLVATDLKRDYVRTFYTVLDEADLAALNQAFAEMEEGARGMLNRSDVPQSRWQITRQADLRYTRQAYELTIPVAGGDLTAAELDILARAFHDRHRQTYGHDNPDEAVQLVNIRVTATGAFDALELSGPDQTTADTGATGQRTVHFDQTGPVTCDIYARDAVPIGQAIAGPVIIESMDSTIVVPPGWQAQCDDKGYIVLEADKDG